MNKPVVFMYVRAFCDFHMAFTSDQPKKPLWHCNTYYGNTKCNTQKPKQRKKNY